MIAKKSVLGMWIFLVTEILFFGALFVAFGINFLIHTQDFTAGVRHMNLGLGSLNTAVLLTSSLLIAWATHSINADKAPQARRLLMGTVLLGLFFLLIKFSEYALHAREHLIPALDWHPDPRLPKATQLFFFMYFLMTLIHALHLLIGLGLVSVYGWRYGLSRDQDYFKPSFENLGLYWHFVDVVWIFLFPCLYLIGRT